MEVTQKNQAPATTPTTLDRRYQAMRYRAGDPWMLQTPTNEVLFIDKYSHKFVVRKIQELEAEFAVHNGWAVCHVDIKDIGRDVLSCDLEVR